LKSRLSFLHLHQSFALTAGIFIEEKDKCLESGMNDYISKPITLHDLETVLLKWVKVFSFKILLKI
jgi:CheY-like chemotaxis protein